MFARGLQLHFELSLLLELLIGAHGGSETASNLFSSGIGPLFLGRLRMLVGCWCPYKRKMPLRSIELLSFLDIFLIIYKRMSLSFGFACKLCGIYIYFFEFAFLISFS